MDEESTPTDLENQPPTDEENMNFQHDEEYANFLENESEMDNISIEDDGSDTNLSVDVNPSLNPREESGNSYSENLSDDIRSTSALPLVINVSGILNTGIWNRDCKEQGTSAQSLTLPLWRAGLIKHIGTVITVKPINKPSDEKRPTKVEENVDSQPNTMLTESKTNQTKLPRFVTSVKNRMSIFRGKPIYKCLGKLFVFLHQKLIMIQNRRDNEHQRYLDDRTLINKRLKERTFLLDQAKCDVLIVNTDGKLFGRDMLSIRDIGDYPWAASIETRVLNKYVVVSPMETKACSDKLPVHLFVRILVEEHAIVVFSSSTCNLCLKVFIVFY